MMLRQVGAFLCLAALPALAGCFEKEPKGAVVAVVNGEEVTLAELNHEAAARNVGNAADPAVRKALLEEVINRKLFAQQAVQKKMDREQSYLLASKRADELLLADTMLKSLVRSSDEPLAADVEAFIKKGALGKHSVFLVDHILFPRPKDPAVIKRLEAAKTLEEVRDILARSNVQMRRMTTPWDSSRMPPDLVRSLQALPPGEVFVITSGDPLVAGVVKSQSQSDVPEEQQRAVAVQALKQQRAQKLVGEWLEGVRRSAKISFQPGYEPAAAKAGAPPAK